MWLVYKMTSPAGRSYIGITENLNMRLSKHLGKPVGSVGPTHIQRALMRYGILRFNITIIQDQISNKDEARSRESYFINERNTIYPNGYNHGAGKNHKCSRVVSNRISRKKMGHTDHVGLKYNTKGRKRER